MASSTDESSDYEEMETEVDNIPCLFCVETMGNDRVLAEHCSTEHAIDIVDTFGRLGDVFHVIKAINYVRRERPSPGDLRSMALAGHPYPWDGEIYLDPAIPDDPLLRVDFEHAYEQLLVKRHGGRRRSSCADDTVALKAKLAIARERITDMQKTVRKIFTHSGNVRFDDSTNQHRDDVPDLAVSTMKIAEDGDYIESYSHGAIHEEMLQDTVRTESYRDAISRNVDLFAEKLCLDVGCGTAILSMFLAREGRAGRVIGVEFSEIIYSAMDIVIENSLDKIIHLKKGKLEDIPDLEQVDVIVSEWMGYFLLYENMLDSVISARDRLLKPGGVLLPNRANLYLTLSDDMELYSKHVGYWDDVYGFKMSCMRKPAISEAIIQLCSPEKICGSTVAIQRFNLNTVTVQDTMAFEAPFELFSERDTEVTAIVGFFDVVFDLPHQVILSTSPRDAPTHWKQTIFVLPKPLKLRVGADSLKGVIHVQRNPQHRRGLKVEFQLADDARTTLTYTV